MNRQQWQMDTRRAADLDNYSRQISARNMMMPPMSAPMSGMPFGGMPYGGGGLPFGGGMPWGGGMHRPMMPLYVALSDIWAESAADRWRRR